MEIGLAVNTVSVYPFPLSQFSSSIYMVHGLINSISLCQNIGCYSGYLHF